MRRKWCIIRYGDYVTLHCMTNFVILKGKLDMKKCFCLLIGVMLLFTFMDISVMAEETKELTTNIETVDSIETTVERPKTDETDTTEQVSDTTEQATNTMEQATDTEEAAEDSFEVTSPVVVPIIAVTVVIALGAVLFSIFKKQK